MRIHFLGGTNDTGNDSFSRKVKNGGLLVSLKKGSQGLIIIDIYLNVPMSYLCVRVFVL